MSPLSDTDPLWDIDQVAAFLKVPKRTLYRWRTLGYGPRGRRVGRHIRYRAAEVVSWFEAIEDRDLEERWR
ncbi:helix-turn-helix domain-containing protein [Kribbella sp. NPDC006257]|uniref:helix-turn-helix transcriptional regulator n=1 Tax=Kribbella sp. NPDC006257 TaxID=3156738 RepID=UPI0033BBF7B5